MLKKPISDRRKNLFQNRKARNKYLSIYLSIYLAKQLGIDGDNVLLQYNLHQATIVMTIIRR